MLLCRELLGLAAQDFGAKLDKRLQRLQGFLGHGERVFLRQQPMRLDQLDLVTLLGPVVGEVHDGPAHLPVAPHVLPRALRQVLLDTLGRWPQPVLPEPFDPGLEVAPLGLPRGRLHLLLLELLEVLLQPLLPVDELRLGHERLQLLDIVADIRNAACH